MEAIWVAAEMRAGAAYVHSALARDTLNALNALDTDTREREHVAVEAGEGVSPISSHHNGGPVKPAK